MGSSSPTDLAGVVSPDDVPRILRNIAQRFNDDAAELRSAWQDDQAGRVWVEIAKILDTAADRCDTAVKRFFA